MLSDINDLSGFTLVKDTLQSDGSFIILHALKLVLTQSQQHSAIVVLTKNSALNLAIVLRKYGIDMLAAVDQGRLVVIDTLRQISAVEHKSQGENTLSIDSLYSQIKKNAGTLPSSSITLLFDDFSALRCVCDSGAADLVLFTRSCLALGEATKKQTNLVALVHADIDDDAQWIERLDYLSNATLQIEGLESGRSTEVTGRVIYSRRDVFVGDQQQLSNGTVIALESSQQYYKLLDTGGIRFIDSLARKLL